MNNSPSKKIDSFQVLRFFAFLGIFCTHSRIFFSFGAWGVSVFFVMSGFLMAYNYFDRELKVGLLESIKFSIKKIKKLYCLHVVMAFVSIPYEIYLIKNFLDIKSMLRLFLQFLINLTLLQTWIPYMDWYNSINGVSWFLSVLMFCYFLFPFVFNYIKRIQNVYICYLIMILIYSSQILFCYITRNCIIDAGEFWGPYYFSYVFPPLRFCDFAIGMLLGIIFIRTKSKLSTNKSTVFEIITIIGIIFSAFLFKNNISVFGSKWFRLTLLYLPSSCCLVYICGGGQSVISKKLQKRFFIELGNRTNNYFLIHNKVIQYVTLIICHFFTKCNCIFFVIFLSEISLILTVFSDILYRKIYNKIISSRNINDSIIN